MKINLVARVGYVEHLPCKYTSYMFIIDDRDSYLVMHELKSFYDFYFKNSYSLDKVIEDLSQKLEVVEVFYYDNKRE